MESPAPKAANQNEKQSLDTWGFPAMVGEIILTMLDLRVLMVSGCATIIAIVGNLPAASVEDVKVGVTHRSAVRLVRQVRGPLDQSEMSIEVT